MIILKELKFGCDGPVNERIHAYVEGYDVRDYLPEVSFIKRLMNRSGSTFYRFTIDRSDEPMMLWIEYDDGKSRMPAAVVDKDIPGIAEYGREMPFANWKDGKNTELLKKIKEMVVLDEGHFIEFKDGNTPSIREFDLGVRNQNDQMRTLIHSLIEMNVDLARTLTGDSYNSVRETLALMAKGEGSDSEVYKTMAKAALDKLDSALVSVEARLTGLINDGGN